MNLAHLLAAAAALALFLSLAGRCHAQEEYAPKPRFGFDNAGSPMKFYQHPGMTEAIASLGFDFAVVHYQPTQKVSVNEANIREIDEWCATHGLEWVANLDRKSVV